MGCTASELSQKEVVNVSDGVRLGMICDFEIDPCDGRITAIYLPGENSLLNLTPRKPIAVPWCNIKRIGADIILVDLPPDIFKDSCDGCSANRKRWFNFKFKLRDKCGDNA